MSSVSLVNLYQHLSAVEQKLYICYVPLNKLFTTLASVKATALQWNDEPKATFENVIKAPSDGSIPKGPTVLMYTVISTLN